MIRRQMTENDAAFLQPRPAQIGDRRRPDHSAQLSLAEVLDFRDVADRRSQSAAHQDLAVRRLGAEAGRQIDDRADRGVVEAILEADAAQRGVTLRHAYPEAEAMAPLAPASTEA